MHFDQANIKNAFKFKWKNLTTSTADTINDYRMMRHWQTLAFERLKDSQYMILNAPMGSGKSWMMCLLSAFKMKQNQKLRTIITVPQTIIAPGFLKAKIEMPDGEKIDWEIKYNLCQGKTHTVKNFIQWLEKKPVFLNEKVLICTHTTLVQVYKRLKLENRLGLLTNTLLWIDEAHHIKNNTVKDVEGITINNGLGELVFHFLKDTSQNIQIGLTTASFFRGDRATLLTDEMEARFDRFNLPYDDYLKSMAHLKSFSFDFLICGDDYIEAIQLLIKQKKGKDIIYIPHPNSLHSNNKHQKVASIISAYKSIHGDDEIDTKDGLKVLVGKDGRFKILDLVNDHQRSQQKTYLKNDVLNKQQDALDAIIALGMFKEGANWIYADRSIIVGARSSLVDVIQMVGRLFRDAENKNHVEVVQLLPFSLDQHNEESFLENLNNYFKAICASLILENILNPVKIKMLSEKPKVTSDNVDRKEIRDWLSQEIPDEIKRQSLIDDVRNELINILGRNNKAIDQVPVLWEEYQKVIPVILNEHGVIENKEEVSRQIWGMMARRTLRIEGIDVEDIDFDILQKTHPLGFLLRYTSGICDINTFQKLRNAFQVNHVVWLSFEDARRFVRSLGLKNIFEWRLYVVNGFPALSILPNNIPKSPWLVYADLGWVSLGDWLGTEIVATRKREYKEFIEAREYARSLKLKSKAEWGQLSKDNNLPKDIPAHADRTYKDAGWIGWGDFLGTGTKQVFMKFEDARSFVRNLGLRNQIEWFNYMKTDFRPRDIPIYPNGAYVNSGWISWGDWLGTGRIGGKNFVYKSFEEARTYIRSIGLKNNSEWREWSKSGVRPKDIPVAPDKTYASQGWIGWGDFLGTGNIYQKSFQSFENSRKFAHSLKLKSRNEWFAWSKSANRPNQIPSNPSKTYCDQGWMGWGDFLGTGTIAHFKKEFRSFKEARDFAIGLSLNGKEDWMRWTKSGLRPIDIPTAPNRTYAKKGWNGWGDWLGVK